MKPWIKKFSKPHTHIAPNGLLINCYHHCTNTLLSLSFWLGVTLSFPIEHLIWEKLWPFKLITVWFGL